jgi:hypothetical protein
MDEHEQRRLRMALGILSGRVLSPNDDTLEKLGYDPYKFSGYGRPSVDEIRRKAEEIVFAAIQNKG